MPVQAQQKIPAQDCALAIETGWLFIEPEHRERSLYSIRPISAKSSQDSDAQADITTVRVTLAMVIQSRTYIGDIRDGIEIYELKNDGILDVVKDCPNGWIRSIIRFNVYSG